MTRQERIALHKKQERLQVKSGAPSVDEVKEGSPVLRFVSGTGLRVYYKYNGQLYYNTLTRA